MNKPDEASLIVFGEYDSAFYKFFRDSLRAVSSERRVQTPVKGLFVEYKKQAIVQNVAPMSYKSFRKALEETFAVFNKEVNLFKKNKTWLISNVCLIDSSALALYEGFYDLKR